MLLAIPSRARHDMMYYGTVKWIPDDLRDRVVVFLHTDDSIESYRAHAPDIKFVKIHYSGIAEKRKSMGEWARNQGYEKFTMMDDDLIFLVRRQHDSWRLRNQEFQDTREMFAAIEKHLDTYPQVGISAREGNNYLGTGGPDELVDECARAMRIVGHRTEDFLALEHCRLPVMEDLDATLQFLESGRKNAVLGYWAQGHFRKTNAEGGCSLWRTLEVHNSSAEKLAELHPRNVRLRQKTNKTDADGFGTRTEVTVYWKKAYERSQELCA